MKRAVRVARDDEARIRLVRLMSGAGRPDDVVRLFNLLRFKSHGASAFREVADFIAHCDDRTKGVVTDELRDAFDVLRFQAPSMGGPPLNWQDLPADFKELMRRNFRRLDPLSIRERTGCARKQAKKTLDEALETLIARANGRIFQQLPMNQMQASVLALCASTCVIKPAFTGDGLFKDFVFVMKRNGLITDGDKKNIVKTRDAVILTAVQYMHQATVVLEDGWNAVLSAGVSAGQIVVHAKANFRGIIHPDADRIFVSFSIFESGISGEMGCSSTLCAVSDIEWDTPIEVAADMRLTTLA